MNTRRFFVLCALLAATACCKNNDSPTPDSSSSTGAGKAAPGNRAAAKAGIGVGTVNAKKTATNQTGRGIVRTAPNFQASEVIRLDPGTQVTVTGTSPGGWYAISWPPGVDSQSGYLHGDVMQVSMH